MSVKPAPSVLKWFPTGHLAWQKYGDEAPGQVRPEVNECPLVNGWFYLVQELFEVEFTGEAPFEEARRTGRHEWRPIPILQPTGATVSKCAEILIPAFDSTLINAAEPKS